MLHAAEEKKIDGMPGALLALTIEAHKALLYRRVTAKPILESSKAVIDYLKASMAHLLFEQVRILYLGLTHRLITDMVVSNGTIDEAPLYPREIIKHALDVGATGLIIAHNHPSGDPTPSVPDIENTRKLIAACREIQIEVHDHIVIAADGWTSMRAERLI